MVLLGLFAGLVGALPIPVPNGSFESPSVVFVSTEFDAWQKNEKPEWYIEDGGFLWSQLTGQFKNPAPGAFDRLDNCDGNQAVWLFAVPGVGIYQDEIPVSASESSDSNGALARFQAGSSYRLAAGVIGGGGGMSNGAPLQVSIYYRDALSNRVTVASTVITHSSSVFPTLTHLVQFQVDTPPLGLNAPCVGQPIGIAIDSTVSPELQGGYWDVDAVRLTEIVPLRIESPVIIGQGLRFEIQSEVGQRIAILVSERLGASAEPWTQIATLTNLTGSLSFTNSSLDGVLRFFRAQALPSE